jgi:signal transduction histidine kinase
MTTDAASALQPDARGATPLAPLPTVQDAEQALLDTLYQQSMRIPIPVAIVAVVVGGLGAGRVPTVALVGWGTAVLLMQALRYVQIRALALAQEQPATRRLLRATILSALNGGLIASSATFFPYLDEVSRAVYSMVMIGMITGSIATSHGYRPIFMAFVLPVLGGLIAAWVVVPGETLTGWMRYAVALLILLLGMVLYALAKDTFRAFTEGFRINAELERALCSERSANNAKTRFLAAASHDLRQPLHTLSLLSAALAMRPLDAKSASIAHIMNEAMSDLATELDALLDISKLDAGVVHVETETIAVAPLVSRIAASFREQAVRKGLSLDIVQDAGPFVRSDRMLLERVLRNLIDNAIKYTSEGGVTVYVGAVQGQCGIMVSDTGKGIDRAEQERIFEEFYQIGNSERDRRKGLGLGLSIVKRLVPLLGGKLSMESLPGRGSSFQIALPAVPEPPATPVPARVPDDTALVGVHLLLIEDDIGVRMATRILLEGMGCRVSEALSTEEAVDAARRSMPDIVLADIRLPNGDDGVEAVSRLRSLKPGLPALFVSGETSPDRLREIDQLGSILLVKPVDRAILIRAISRSLNPAMA